jgi:phage baseplate assembly protein V
MMNHLQNQMRLQAGLVAGNINTCAWGIIDSYDSANHSVKVRRQPEDPEDPAASLSNWMPLPTMWTGNGWGMKAAPKLGELVMVGHIEGNANEQVVLGFCFNDEERPPAGDAGEFVLVHESGSFLKLLDNGKLTLNGNVEIDLSAPKVVITTTGDTEINATGNANITGAQVNLIATGSLSLEAPEIQMGADGQAIGGLTIFDALKTAFDNHTHPAPGGETSVPTQPLPLSAKTSTIKGG